MPDVVTLGGGCFWCLEAVFERVRGVTRVVSGYAGGSAPSPSYEHVCTGATGHAEVVQVTFDRSIVTFAQLLEIFFAIHDPTTPDRQGADVGTQYRSVIYTHTPEQAQVARTTIDQLTRDGVFDGPIVTDLAPLEIFYPAEDYHQGYFRANPTQGYCSVVISPKLVKARQRFAQWMQRAGDQT